MKLDIQQVEALLQRAKAVLSPEDYEIIKAMADTIYLLSQSLDKKNTSIGRLLRMIFGVTTEKLEKAAGRKKAPSSKPPGHGRKSAADYTGGQGSVPSGKQRSLDGQTKRMASWSIGSENRRTQ